MTLMRTRPGLFVATLALITTCAMSTHTPRAQSTPGPGETSKTITAAVNGDRKREADETFKVNLSSADGATLFDSQGAGVIRNDDR